MRSSTLVSVIDPVTSRTTSGASDASRRLTSSVMIDEPLAASRVTRPWPISPSAPVMRTTGLRTLAPLLPFLPLPPFLPSRREQHVGGGIGHHDDDQPAHLVDRQRHDEVGGDQHGRETAGDQPDRGLLV